MRRFFVPADCFRGETVQVPDALAHRLRRVLRLHDGDHIILFDGNGSEFEAKLDSVARDGVVARVIAQKEGLPEPKARVVLYQAVSKGDRFDWVLEKGTELGVAAFVPLVVQRSVVVPRGGQSARSERWRRIVIEAAEQCGRSRIPQVAPPTGLDDALASAPGLWLLPWEGEKASGIKSVLRRRLAASAADSVPPAVSIFIGPEGGFADDEVEQARQRGVEVVSLGRRILRSETAGIASAAIVLYESGEFGG